MRAQKIAIFTISVLVPLLGHAFSDGAFGIGVGYYSEDVFNATSQYTNGTTGTLGEPNYPLLLKYDFGIGTDWFLAPQLIYTPSPRTDAGGYETVSIGSLLFLIGENFSSGNGFAWDWYIGPGLLNYQIKGSSGTTQLNNGTSTSTFGIPGTTESINKIVTDFGTSMTFSSSRVGLEMIVESLLSTSRRTESLMLSYAYQFGSRL